MKKLFALSTFMVCLTSLLQATPTDYALAWDLDGVLFEKTSKLVWAKAPFKINFFKSGRAMRKQRKECGNGSISTWMLLCQKNNDTRGQKFFRKLILKKKVYPTVGNLIKNLHTKGYKQFRASNIGEGEVRMHEQKHTTRAIFGCFQGGVDVQDAPGQHPLKKPSQAYFTHLKNIMHNACGPNLKLVFIDDNKDNIQAAKKAGFIAAHCTDPEKLPSELGKLGITA